MNSPLSLFLSQHQIKKDSKDNSNPPTNTRIGCKESKIFGGSYHIPDDKYDTFLKLYFKECIKGKKKEYLTEAQLKENGPLLIDIDFRYNYEIMERKHTKEHIVDLITLYLEEFKNIFEVDDTNIIPFFVFEKDTVNRIEEKKITKDGIHIIVGIQCENHDLQQMIRKSIIEKINDIWEDIPITNSWDEVFDEGISKGHTNFQLYGSMKPNNEPYRLVAVYNGGYDESNNVIFHNTQTPSEFENENNFNKLSIRYREHKPLLLKSEIVDKLQELKRIQKQTTTIHESTTTREKLNHEPEPENLVLRVEEILKIQTKAQLDECVSRFLDSLEIADFNIRDAYDYTMALSKSYYGEGSFSKWIRVGWALRNISNRLFIVWLSFSAKSPSFNLTLEVSSLYDKWCSFEKKEREGFTIRSLIYWAKTDNYEEYVKINNNSINTHINKTLEHAVFTTNEDDNKILGFTDYDLALVLYLLNKDKYVCVNIKNNIWYFFDGNSWSEIDSGTTLRSSISRELRGLYIKKSSELGRMKLTLAEGDPMKKKIDRKMHILATITEKFGKTNDKNNIMREARELFYDGEFLKKLDSNPYIICFKNCVVDFKEKRARRGNPEDYLSKCTGINYIELNQSRDKTIIDEIEDFMHKLFPDEGLYRYMWQHLASTLIGTTSNQTFNMYIGVGQNGKSVLVNLMETVLGQYKGDVPLTLITQQRTKIGGVSPEIIQLKGIRYAVMQEPSKGDRINEGIMKQISAGDPITGRAPFMVEAQTFIPQFKLVVCSNELMEIKSQDHGTWRRIRVVDFKSLFTENPRNNDKEKPYQFKLDKNIKDKFHKWKEVFAAMLVEIAYKTGGDVEDCPEVTASTMNYRQGQDIISSYLLERIQIYTNGCITKGQLSTDYKEWYTVNYGNGKVNGIKDLFVAMDKRYTKGTGNLWKNVRFVPITSIDIETVTEDSDLDTVYDINLEEL